MFQWFILKTKMDIVRLDVSMIKMAHLVDGRWIPCKQVLTNSAFLSNFGNNDMTRQGSERSLPVFILNKGGIL